MFIFSYTSNSSTGYDITYNVTDVTQSGTETLRDGEKTKLLNQAKTIMAGETAYFQVERLPGTVLTVEAENATVCEVTASGSKSSDDSTSSDGLTQTYKLTNATGAVTVKIKAAWKKADDYQVNLTVTSTSLDSVPNNYRDGRIRIMTVENEGKTNGDDQNAYKEAGAKATYTNNTPVLTDTQTVKMCSNIQNNKVSWYYVTNSIGYKVNGNNTGWRQRLAAITVNGETVAIPDIFVGGAEKKTVLTKGDAKGTVVRIWNYDVESSDTRQNINDDIQRYGVEVSGVHSDLDIKMIYAPYGTQGVIWMTYALGVTPQLYLVPDWGDTNYETIPASWIDLNVGNYYYQKNSGGVFQVRWKRQAGYYNSSVTLNYNGSTKTITESDVGKPVDGYYTANIGAQIAIGKTANLTFTASPVKYKAAYDGNGGTYSSMPTDNNTYDSAGLNQIIIASAKPTKTGSLFQGYVIDGEANGVVFQPGDLLDVNDSRLDLSGLQVNANGEETITFKAKWLTESYGSAMTNVSVTTRKLTGIDSEGKAIYEESKDEFLMATGASYVVTPNADNDTWAFIANESTGLSGVAGTDNAVLTYKHPTTVVYKSDPDATALDIVDACAYEPSNIDQRTLTKDSVEETTQSDDGSTQVIKKTTYEHVGWMDTLGNYYGLSNDKTTSSTGPVPWDGLTLYPRWTVTTITNAETISAEDFTLTQAQVKALLAMTDAGALKAELIKYGDAKAWNPGVEGQPPVDITEVTYDPSLVVTNGTVTPGKYTITYATNLGTSETVTVEVLARQARTGKLSANAFVLTQDQAHTLAGLTDQVTFGVSRKTALINYAGAQAWLEGAGSDGTLEISSATTTLAYAEKKTGADGETKVVDPGFYTATFTTEALELDDTKDLSEVAALSKTVVVMVLPENIEASDFNMTIGEVKRYMDADAETAKATLIEKAKAAAWNGTDKTSEADIGTANGNQIEAKPGTYPVTFTTTYGATETVNCTVGASVTYSFQSGTADKELPEAVTQLVPTDSSIYAKDETVHALLPTQVQISADGGTWTFNGYTSGSKQTVDDQDLHFLGTWTFSTQSYVPYVPVEIEEHPIVGEEDQTDEPEANDESTPTEKSDTTKKGSKGKTQTGANQQTVQASAQNDELTSPRTGDNQTMGLWLFAALLSAGILCLLKRKAK